MSLKASAGRNIATLTVLFKFFRWLPLVRMAGNELARMHVVTEQLPVVSDTAVESNDAVTYEAEPSYWRVGERGDVLERDLEADIEQRESRWLDCGLWYNNCVLRDEEVDDWFVLGLCIPDHV